MTLNKIALFDAHCDSISRFRVYTEDTLRKSSGHLDLERVAGFDFDVALYTNLSQDHLDFHSSMEEYAAAKQRLRSTASGYGSPYTTTRYGSGCSGTDLCTSLLCADCLCECCGGDLISCC